MNYTHLNGHEFYEFKKERNGRKMQAIFSYCSYDFSGGLHCWTLELS